MRIERKMKRTLAIITRVTRAVAVITKTVIETRSVIGNVTSARKISVKPKTNLAGKKTLPKFKWARLRQPMPEEVMHRRQSMISVKVKTMAQKTKLRKTNKVQ
jgi:hypothetical protein